MKQLVQFNLEALKAFAEENRPDGYFDDVCAHGKVEDGMVFLNLEVYDFLKGKYQGPTTSRPTLKPIVDGNGSSLPQHTTLRHTFEEVLTLIDALPDDDKVAQSLRKHAQGVQDWIAEKRFSSCWLRKQKNSVVTMYETALNKNLIVGSQEEKSHA